MAVALYLGKIFRSSEPIRMGALVLPILKHLLFWMLAFASLKIFWILYNHTLIENQSSLFTCLIKSFEHGFFLDLAMSAQLSIAALFVWFVTLFVIPTRQRQVQKYFLCFVLSYIVLIHVGESVTYKHWGAKLNFRALQILYSPSELFAIATPTELLGLFSVMAAFYFALLLLAFRLSFFFDLDSSRSLVNRVKILAISLLLTAPLLLAARGGWKQIPINASSAHFSHIPVLNDSATNPAWHFTKSVLTYSVFIGRNNPYLSFSAQEKRAYLDLFIKGDRSSQKHEPLVVTNPNIVFLILESWSSDIIKKLGGFKNVTPNFDKLTSDGILFTNFFASGNRSQQGLAALFGGFPALPYGTAAEDTSFTKSMPKLVHHLSTKGYSSHFYYGGQLQFGNIKTLLLYNGFKNLTEEWDLPSNLLRGQMGVHDGPMLDLFLEHINQQQRSHVSAFFSVSTHTPFDIDYDWSPSEGKPTDQRYLVSARYADNELGKFFEHAKSKEWYKNTLFVLVADHSYPTSINSSSFQANYRRIPLLLLGGAISPKLRGTTVSRISSQVDLPATIGTQFGFSQENLKWSRNLFAENFEEYAYYEVNDGAGMVLPHMALRFDSTNGNCYNRQEIQITAEKECFFTKAFVQDLVESFISGSQTHLFNQHKVSY